MNPPSLGNVGVRIAGSGMCVPDRVLSNADLESMMDTSDEWIVQRTGIRERRIADRENKGETARTLATEALRRAVANAKLDPTDLDAIIVATVTPDMACPPTASRVAADIGATGCPGWDLNAACTSFVFALNSANALVRSGLASTVGVIGTDMLSRHMRYDTKGRATAILFGDAAGALVVKATDDTTRGVLAQSMHSDGSRWDELYIPRHADEITSGEQDPELIDTLLMNGRSVFKFAVSTFGDLIQETLDQAGVTADQVDHFVCHQSNARILASARDRFGIPEDKLLVNIDRYGNTVSASVPVVFQELVDAGKVKEGQLAMFLAFGGGLTWGSSLWRL